MEKLNRTIDDIFAMSDSRYSLVNAISRKAREIADEAETNNDVLYRKPVNMVIDRLLDGRATIEHIEEVEADDLFADDEPPIAPLSSEIAPPTVTTVPIYAELAEAEDEDEEQAEQDEQEEQEDEEDYFASDSDFDLAADGGDSDEE